MNQQPKRIAIFGGTFDPIHNAHLEIAREALRRFQLDRVLFVTAGRPPHKTRGVYASYEDRHRMVELACAGEPRFEPSRLEEGDQVSYSIDTVNRVREMLQPGDRLFFLIGADAFSEISSWRRWQDLIRLVEFIVVTRPGHSYSAPEGAMVHTLETVAIPVSSSEIRSQLAAGILPKDLPPAVLAYIQARGLYLTSTPPHVEIRTTGR